MQWFDWLTRNILGEHYLVLETGHEGIERVYGVFGRRKATEFALEKKKLADKREAAWTAREEVFARVAERSFKESDGDSEAAFRRHKADPEMIAAEAEHGRSLEKTGHGPHGADFVCVVTVSEKGTRCACNELGLSASKPMLR